jgi:2-oxoglutarate/2-oxoacid ferredoxin oxidoreductase subunit beta
LIQIEPDYNPCDYIAATNYVQQHHAKGEVVTGLLYVDPEPSDLHSHLGTVEVPLNRLGVVELSPGPEVLESINGG